MKDGTQNKNIHKHVFKWVKQKQIIPSNSLMKDGDGNIITNPVDAINEINLRWDEIYSSNILHEDPNKVLSCVWPYIQDRRLPASIPDLDGPSLRKQVLTRRLDACPGLDGWRTLESHMLPDILYTSIANYFIDVGKGVRTLPLAMITAKQVILEKASGLDSRLQKRLITVLPVFLHSGPRYKKSGKEHQLMSKQLTKECSSEKMKGGLFFSRSMTTEILLIAQHTLEQKPVLGIGDEFQEL